jgi:hypothetical protein
MIILKYSPYGITDHSFGSNGLAEYTGNNGSYGCAMFLASLEAHGNTAAGSFFFTAGGVSKDTIDMADWKYSSAGSLNTAFGSGGMASYDRGYGTGTDLAYALAPNKSSTKLFSCGSTTNSQGAIDMTLCEYDIYSGALTTAFGTSGIVNYDGGNGTDSGRGIALDSRGRILVVGAVTNSSAVTDMTIWRYK